jgi:hypothetical protein
MYHRNSSIYRNPRNQCAGLGVQNIMILKSQKYIISTQAIKYLVSAYLYLGNPLLISNKAPISLGSPWVDKEFFVSCMAITAASRSRNPIVYWHQCTYLSWFLGR